MVVTWCITQQVGDGRPARVRMRVGGVSKFIVVRGFIIQQVIVVTWCITQQVGDGRPARGRMEVGGQ